jgi:hypothetical protein
MDKLITNLLALLKTTFSSDFKSYEYGKIEIPANSELPLITVNPVSTVVSNSGTSRDENNFTIEVVVMASLKNYLNNVSGSGEIRSALQGLVKWVEDRETTGEVKNKSVMAVIRQNITANEAVLFNNDINVNYGDYVTNDEFPMVKAIISFTAQSRSKRV